MIPYRIIRFRITAARLVFVLIFRPLLLQDAKYFKRFRRAHPAFDRCGLFFHPLLFKRLLDTFFFPLLSE